MSARAQRAARVYSTRRGPERHASLLTLPFPASARPGLSHPQRTRLVEMDMFVTESRLLAPPRLVIADCS